MGPVPGAVLQLQGKSQQSTKPGQREGERHEPRWDPWPQPHKTPQPYTPRPNTSRSSTSLGFRGRGPSRFISFNPRLRSCSRGVLSVMIDMTWG